MTRELFGFLCSLLGIVIGAVVWRIGYCRATSRDFMVSETGEFLVIMGVLITLFGVVCMAVNASNYAYTLPSAGGVK